MSGLSSQENKSVSREARLDTILANAGEAFGIRVPVVGVRVVWELVDEEGDRLIALSDEFLDVLDHVNDSFALSILQQMHRLALKARESGYKSGVSAGRAQIVGTVHELLGIYEIRESIAKIESAVYEAGGRR